MSIEAVFLADILAHPDDDVPRLIYADWLEENGGAPRAEFIRIQSELARLPATDARLPGLQERERELLTTHESAWTAGVQERGVTFARFARGFVEGVTIHADRFLETGEELYALTPVREVSLDNVAPNLSRLSRRTALFRGLRVVRLSKPLDGVHLPAEPLVRLLSSPDLAGLRTLDLRGAYVGRAGLPPAEIDSMVPALEELGLAMNELGDLGLQFLLMHFADRKLRALDLRFNGLTDHAAEMLAAWPGAEHLRWLSLEGNPVTAAGAEAILGSRHLRGLRHLGIGHVGGPAQERLRQRFGT